ncbi:hypothetical protein AYO44_03415 [Planctomycetaceae bacterium SCGC AG-212-F19]|nr:hypothetical protein AYO44_03415 [Planctomycetaceae bacterium SCGC AG-212-F19]
MVRFPRLPRLLACGTAILAVLAFGNLSSSQTASAPGTVEFNRDIRPILSDACFTCHGPDKARRKADLRLDTEEGAFADLGDTKIITPRNLTKSELYQRLVTPNAKKRMPPASTGRKLTEREVQLLARWIEQGAKWEPHWSFIPPKRSAKPQVTQSSWVRNPIDAFILARLEALGLSPSPEAERATLVRRVTLDLTGLPPTPEEVTAALSDKADDWYEKVVDRLLASPRYGEHMAIRWLDAARYADTNGYQSDGERTMWRWRDWVIGAFNKNMPFDQFTVEQIAGDLLAKSNLDQKTATGFNRNHRGNAEGGIIPEEYAVEYVADRVETTATVWMGLTMTCARCHDHKYDPVKQREYYQLFAFFNNLPERGKAIKYGNSPPFIRTPTPDQQEQLEQIEVKLRIAGKMWEGLQPQLAQDQAAWEKGLGAGSKTQLQRIEWTPTEHLVARIPLDRGDLRFEDGKSAYAPGRVGRAADLDGKRYVNAGDLGDFGFYDKFTLAAWVFPKGTQGGTILSRMTDTARADGYSVRLENGKLHLNLIKRWLDDAIRVETERALPPDRWYHVAVSYDGSRLADGVKVYVDGRPATLKVVLDDLNQSFKTKEPLRIGAGGGSDTRFTGLIDDVRIFNNSLPADDVALIACTDPITDILALAAAKRSHVQARKLRAYFLEKHAAPPVREARQSLIALRHAREALVETLPTTMVMEEMPKPRATFVLARGEYDKPGTKVTSDVPAIFPRLPAPAPRGPGLGEPVGFNRLDFARWLVDPAHPLTARVAVNRYWQSYFGTGLVKTVDDFGAQGEWPSHPELLDWLATEFGRTGWDVKAMHRVMVTSATYRQSSKVTKTLLEKDPENRLLARGPRLRLPAETIRDQALAASGLLVERVGGPSVKPYQPAGLWKDLVESAAGDYVADRGPSLYRRSLYTFWKRTVAPPGMMTFDAAGREFCQVRQARTNTPLQALNLMNDITYVEAARVLGQRVMREGGATTDDRLALAFRLVMARTPRPAELQVLGAALRYHRSQFDKDREAALKLVTSGAHPRDEKLDPAELAAYTAVAGMILNLDEAITKE